MNPTPLSSINPTRLSPINPTPLSLINPTPLSLSLSKATRLRPRRKATR
jgi:hypothetical protein